MLNLQAFEILLIMHRSSTFFMFEKFQLFEDKLMCKESMWILIMLISKSEYSKFTWCSVVLQKEKK